MNRYAFSIFNKNGSFICYSFVPYRYIFTITKGSAVIIHFVNCFTSYFIISIPHVLQSLHKCHLKWPHIISSFVFVIIYLTSRSCWYTFWLFSFFFFLLQLQIPLWWNSLFRDIITQWVLGKLDRHSKQLLLRAQSSPYFSLPQSCCSFPFQFWRIFCNLLI